MSNVALHTFIAVHRDELIRRCRVTASREGEPVEEPPKGRMKLDQGVPVFLDQLVDELKRGPSGASAIRRAAVDHGRELLSHGFTVGQVVHAYGDICQSVTNLAVELSAPISTDDFRTLNRCLDDAIASAVTEFSREQDVGRLGLTHQLRVLSDTALAGFEVLQEGNVGVGGSTGALVHRSLIAIRALADVSLPQKS
jgi:hypothetical protein